MFFDKHIEQLLARYFSSLKGSESEDSTHINMIMGRLGFYSSPPLTLRLCAINAGRSHEWVRKSIANTSEGVAGMCDEADLEQIVAAILHLTKAAPVNLSHANLILSSLGLASKDASIDVSIILAVADFFSVEHNLLLTDDAILINTKNHEGFIVNKIMRYLKSEVKAQGFVKVRRLAQKVSPGTHINTRDLENMIYQLTSYNGCIPVIDRGIISLSKGSSPIYLLARKLFSIHDAISVEDIWSGWLRLSKRNPHAGDLSVHGLINAILSYDEFELSEEEDRLICVSPLTAKNELTRYERVVLDLFESHTEISRKQAISQAVSKGLKANSMGCIFTTISFITQKPNKKWALIGSDKADSEMTFEVVASEVNAFSHYKVGQDTICIVLPYSEQPLVATLPGEVGLAIKEYPNSFSVEDKLLNVDLIRYNSRNFLKGLSRHLRRLDFTEGQEIVIEVNRDATLTVSAWSA